MVDLTNLSVTEIVENLPKYISPEKAKGIDAVIQFRIAGEGGGDWVLTVKDAKATVTNGVVAKPTLALAANTQDFKDLLSGKANPTQMFMMGKVKVTGDINAAMKLMTLFKF